MKTPTLTAGIMRLLCLLTVLALPSCERPSKRTVLPYLQGRVEVYAHRGARSYSPENTLPGYATGLAIGTDWVDMDIVMTKDSVIVVSHDIRLNPALTRGRDGAFFTDQTLIKDLTFKELQQFDVGRTDTSTAYSKFFPAQHGLDSVRIPALREVIRYVKGKTAGKVGFQIEFKTDPSHEEWTFTPALFAKALYRVMTEEGIVTQCEIQSFDWRCLYEIRKLDPRVKTAYLTEWDNEPGAPCSFFDPDPVMAGLWTGGKLVKDHKNSIPQMVKDLGGTCWEPEDAELTKSTLDEAHRLGLKVVVWTWPEHTGRAFDVAMVDKLITWGVDGIITDDPGMLISMLAARNIPVPARY